MKQSHYDPNWRRFPPPNNHNHPPRPPFHHHRQPYPNPNPLRRTLTRLPPNFIIHLRPDPARTTQPQPDSSIHSLLSEHDRLVSSNGTASLHFSEWIHAFSAMTRLWDQRLKGAHFFTPVLQSNVLVPSDSEELERGLRSLFVAHVRGLIDGEEARRWKSRLERKSEEISEVAASLKAKGTKHKRFFELAEKQKGLIRERELIEKRIWEFKSAMGCILRYLEGEEMGEEVEGEEGYFRVFELDGKYNWERIHRLVLREIRRLEDGLPIYAFRQDILRRIRSEQVIVLIGETGSGKSTQLAQFLADSGVAANESIVCTQPRKIAAASLADRVWEESLGCYVDKSVVSCPTFSSMRQFDSKIVYTTDNYLLQHYMHDRNFSAISCVIVDEAHERSLNTDLLLALIKGLLYRRLDLRLVIMSATADADQLSHYFFGCNIFHVMGRNFPVDVRYIPTNVEGIDSAIVAPYVFEVVRVATEIHKTAEDGTILAFLTSQTEVEWACEEFRDPAAIAFPLHGKLSFQEQNAVFQNYPGQRKVIFATNVAETSLTIPGVKYVVDSGMAKQSKFEPATGMNVLRVCRISRSSAQQRAGRAGRTGPGRCYRLYSDCDFESMPSNDEPEIRRVHLGVAVLRILALSSKNLKEFDFVDAPSAKAIDMATRNLMQLGAITWRKDGTYHLTQDGRYLVKLGIEPRLGKLILSCFHNHLGKEGLVLAAVMANASSIFCRVGSVLDKQKADCLKVPFCHCNGDLFTLLSVYKEWEALPQDKRNRWCWENSVNAKSMRRCADTVNELESCLEKELSIIIPSNWHWDPHKSTEPDKYLKRAILSALAENVAMYTGYDRLGYEVALTGQHVHLHPSCSLLTFCERPSWVVFGELLSMSNQYLVCVSAFDFESLFLLCPPPLFDIPKMEARKLQVKVMTGFGSTLLKKLCGKSNNNLLSLVSHVRAACKDERIAVEVDVDRNEILLFATSEDMENVLGLVNEALDCHRKWMRNECIEKFVCQGAAVSSSVALFGAGAEIKHLELEKRCLTVDVFHPQADIIVDKELMMFLEKHASGAICSVHKSASHGQDTDEKKKWGSITFLSPDAATRVTQLNGVEFCGSVLGVGPSRTTFGNDHRSSPFPAVKAKVYWPRRRSNGFGIVKCWICDVDFMISELSGLEIGGRILRCEVSRKSADSLTLFGLDKDLSEADVLNMLRTVTRRRIIDFFLVRGDAVGNLPLDACEKALLREITPFMPNGSAHGSSCRVQIFQPEPKDNMMRALITFDGRLHLEAARALEHMEGKVLPGFLSWQKIKCQQLFQSSISCSASIYAAIEKHLLSLVKSFNCRNGVECSLDKNANGSYRVRISANATRTVAELRRPLEDLMRGKTIQHASLTLTVLRHLFSQNGIHLMKSIQRATGTYILFDRHSYSLKIFGPSGNVADAQQRLIKSLLEHHESRQLEIHLRGEGLPPDLMKEVVKKFGPNLCGLAEKVPGVELTLNTRQHVIAIQGNKDLKQKIEEIIFEIAQMSHRPEKCDDEVCCPICLCNVDDGYRLEGCGHLCCRLCLVEQLESAVRSLDSFPLCCAHKGCRVPMVVSDLRALLSSEKLEELFRASLVTFVASSGGSYRFCPSPDCPLVYRVAEPGTVGEPFVCAACHTEICTSCHLEYHPYLSCERYREFKEDPDSSLKEWCKGKEYVKNCPVCGYTIEKVEGCNHVECKCGRHICWVCLEFYNTSDDCYGHLRSVHLAIS